MISKILLTCALMLFLIPLTTSAAPPADDFTDEFPLADCDFRAGGNNAYFSLAQGTQLHLSNQGCFDEGDCDEFEEIWITVLPRTHKVNLDLDGEMKSILTRVIEEFEEVDGELAEISRNFFALCRGTGDIYYFGEEVDIYEDGEIVSHAGAWEAGENGAMPGIFMPGGAFLLGARYFQEVAPDVALDRAEHVDMGLDIEVPAGLFENCVEIEETTPLEPKAVSTKIYCPGVGLTIDEDLQRLPF